MHLNFLLAHQSPRGFHVIGHDGPRALCIAFSQSRYQPLLVIPALFPKLDIGRRVKAAVHGKIRQEIDHEVDDETQKRVLRMFGQELISPT